MARDNLWLLVIVLLALATIGAFPTWPYSRSWGFWPGTGLGVILVIILILVLAGRF